MTKIITTCIYVLLNVGLAFTQQKELPPGFPVDCPTVNTVTKKEANNPSTRISSDLLVNKAAAILNQPSKETVLSAIDSLEKYVKIDSTNAEAFYQLSSAYGLAPRYASMLKKTGEEKSMFYFSKLLV